MLNPCTWLVLPPNVDIKGRGGRDYVGQRGAPFSDQGPILERCVGRYKRTHAHAEHEC
jgi:hypothetical protein